MGIFPHYLIAAGGEEVIEHGDFGVDAEIAFGIAVGVEHPGCGRRKFGSHRHKFLAEHHRRSAHFAELLPELFATQQFGPTAMNGGACGSEIIEHRHPTIHQQGVALSHPSTDAAERVVQNGSSLLGGENATRLWRIHLRGFVP